MKHSRLSRSTSSSTDAQGRPEAGVTHSPQGLHGETQARDEAFLSRIREGDTRAFEALLRGYAAELTDFAYKTVGSYDLAEEVVQDVFVNVWEHRTTLNIYGSVVSYLYRAIRNRALNVLRRERSQSRIADTTEFLMPLVTENLGAIELDADDVHTEVRRLLQMVPPRCREIFLLVWENELSYAEVASRLGISERSVQNQYYRAISALARAMGPKG